MTIQLVLNLELTYKVCKIVQSHGQSVVMVYHSFLKLELFFNDKTDVPPFRNKKITKVH